MLHIQNWQLCCFSGLQLQIIGSAQWILPYLDLDLGPQLLNLTQEGLSHKSMETHFLICRAQAEFMGGVPAIREAVPCLPILELPLEHELLENRNYDHIYICLSGAK